MVKDDSILLGHILDTAVKIANGLRDAPREEFDADEDLRYSITYQIQVIGEAASNLFLDFPQKLRQVPRA